MKTKTHSQHGFLGLRALIAFALFAGALCCLVTGTLLAFFRAEAGAKASHPAAAGLTFADRVAYQRAIEEVYWRHRIWPKENSDPKPSLDQVMSSSQLEKKVADYLRNSQALEDHWQGPITSEQSQAEMDRMARHTRQPEVLRELFEALGNDPLIIAECLARPVLTERLSADLSAQNKTNHAQSARTNGLPGMSMATRSDSGGYTLPKISEEDPPCIGDNWRATSTTNAPTARAGHTAVWTGSEMIVWSGGTGGKYNPSTDSWTATSTTNAPTAQFGRFGHTAVWTGNEMIVWGGDLTITIGASTGGRYNPSTDRWTATSTTNAPSSRRGHTAVWTGSQMIIWGGFFPFTGARLNTGGRYNPITDSWTTTSTAHAPSARSGHEAVWTGSEMIVWGGGFDTTGGRYNPSTNTWTATSTTNAPTARSGHTAVWTGSEMIVWGGFTNPDIVFNTGGRYNPGTNSWTATRTANAPDARVGHTAVWAGSEMIVWGGLVYDPNRNFNTGGRYNPGTNSWTATSTISAPSAREAHSAVWTDSEMIIWGGYVPDSAQYLNTGGRYCAEEAPAQLGNISTRAFVQTGDDVMIGGFIIQGTGTKRVIIRVIAPELTQFGVTGAMADPTLELHDGTQALIARNDNWQTSIIGGIITSNQTSAIQNSDYAPGDARECAIIADLPAGNYTAIVRGVNNTTGVALVEVYDLSSDTTSILGNISTRSFVQTGNNVVIGGFIVRGTTTKRVIIRAIGPELTQFGVTGPMADPTLELHDGANGLIASNNNWQTTIIGGTITSSQVNDIHNSGLAPTATSESAIIANLPPGNYTAIVRGVNNTTGVALVEVYAPN